MSENENPGEVIIVLSAKDDDLGEIITYDWVSVPADFTLDQSSGEILLAGKLDRETTSSYTLKVSATDGSNAVTATVQITVLDVNDNTPKFDSTKYE